jgi:heme/copper-type cytochrome/quinol oxidase subunit 2
MEYPFFLSFIGLFVAVILIAQSSITIYNYSKNNQVKDLNYWWSVSVLVIAIIAAIGSTVSMFYHRESAKNAIAGARVGGASVANLQAKAAALENLQKAQAAAAGAFKTE